MQDAILQSGWENFLVAVSFVGLVVVAFFRLDEIIASPKRDGTVKRCFCGSDGDGHLVLSDPDGRPWSASTKTV